MSRCLFVSWTRYTDRGIISTVSSMRSYGTTLGAVLVLAACGGSTDHGGGAVSSSSGSTAGVSTGSPGTDGAATHGSGGSSNAEMVASSSAGGSATAGTGGLATTGGNVTGGNATGGAGAPPAASCDAPGVPCGGSVVGTWSVVSSCLEVSGEIDLSGYGLRCSAAPVTGTLEVSGTLKLYDDGTLEDGTITTGESEFYVAAACIEVTPATCNRLDRPLAALGYASVACVDDNETEGCTCTATVAQSGAPAFVSPNASPSGTYTTENDVLATAEPTDVEYGYCVQQYHMTLTPQTESKTGTVTGEIVLQGQ